jgi:hypothetical protein
VEGDESEAFSLLGKNGNMVALASSTNNLTFCFCPQEIKEYKAVFVVKMSDQISWKYPILGISEMQVDDQMMNLQTMCKQPVCETFKLYPPGIPLDIQEEELKVELGGIPK